MRNYYRIPLLYFLLGFFWILLSDRILQWMVSDPESLSNLQTIKGWAYVFISTLLLLYLTRREVQREEAHEANRIEVFQSVLRGAHHILGNYLNGMQLITFEAERSSDFDQKLVEMAKEESEKAAEELKRLGELKDLTAKRIDEIVYRKLNSRSALR